MGGNAFTYDFCLPRLVRDAQVLTIWEGQANIQAIEMLRMLARFGGLAPVEERAHHFLDPFQSNSAHRGASVTPLGQSEIGHAAGALRPREAERHARNLMDYLADIVSPCCFWKAPCMTLAAATHARRLSRSLVDSRLDRIHGRAFEPGRPLHERTFDALINSETVPIAELAPKAPLRPIEAAEVAGEKCQRQ